MRWDPSGYCPCENFVKFNVENVYLPIVQKIEQTVSNAPGIEKLEGLSYQLGGSYETEKEKKIYSCLPAYMVYKWFPSFVNTHP